MVLQMYGDSEQSKIQTSCTNVIMLVNKSYVLKSG